MRIITTIVLLLGVAFGQVTYTPHLNLGKPPYQYPHYETILNPNFDVIDDMVPASSCLTDGTEAVYWDGINKKFVCVTLAGGAPAFSAVTPGTNTGALHIGTGGSLDATGTETIDGTFLQSGTGAVQRTASSKMKDVVSVKDFGAAGTGGDDTPFFVLALAASQSVYVPCGTYNVTALALTSGHTLFGPETHMDFNAAQSCAILQSSTGDILIAGGVTTANVDIYTVTTGDLSVGFLLGGGDGLVAGSGWNNRSQDAVGPYSMIEDQKAASTTANATWTTASGTYDVAGTAFLPAVASTDVASPIIR